MFKSQCIVSSSHACPFETHEGHLFLGVVPGCEKVRFLDGCGETADRDEVEGVDGGVDRLDDRASEMRVIPERVACVGSATCPELIREE